MKENKKQKLSLEGLHIPENANLWIGGKHVKGNDPNRLDKHFEKANDPYFILENYIRKDEELFSEIHYSFHQRYGESGQRMLNLGHKEKPLRIEIKKEYIGLFLGYLEGWIDSKGIEFESRESIKSKEDLPF